MKHLLITFTLLFCTVSLVNAQSRVKEKNLLGTWKLVIDIDEEMEDAKDEADDSVLGSIIMNSVSGLVTGLIEEIEIYMNFRPDGELKVIVEAFGEKDVDYGKYEIRDGKLFIPDNDHLKLDDGDYWLLDKDLLIVMEDGERNENIYMVKLD